MAENDSKSATLTKVFEDFLRAIGKSPGRNEELMETPVRAASMWLEELLDGYEWNADEILSGGTAVTESEIGRASCRERVSSPV